MKYSRYLLMAWSIILGVHSIGFTQAEIEFNSTGITPHLDLIETTDNGFTRLFFRNSNALSDKWGLSGKLGTDANQHQFGLFYNGSKRWIYDEPLSQFQIQGSQQINNPNSDDNMVLTSRQISVKDENGITLFQLGDSGAGALDEGQLWLYWADGITQKNGIFLEADDNDGGEITLYNGDGIQRAFLKAGPENVNEARLHLEGVSENLLETDGVARHLIALVNDKASIGTGDDQQFYIGIWEDVINTMPLVTEEAISFAFTTGGTEPTNSDVIAKIDQSGNFETSSDRRLKDNIQSLDNVLDKVLSLNPSTYHFKRDIKKQNQIGFIAQDIDKYFPELADGDDSIQGQFMTVNYQGMVPVLTKAIQEQHEIIEDLQAEIKAIKDQLEDLK